MASNLIKSWTYSTYIFFIDDLHLLIQYSLMAIIHTCTLINILQDNQLFLNLKAAQERQRKREIQQQALVVLVKTIKSLASSIIDLPVQLQEVKFPSIYNHQRKTEKSLHIIVV